MPPKKSPEPTQSTTRRLRALARRDLASIEDAARASTGQWWLPPGDRRGAVTTDLHTAMDAWAADRPRGGVRPGAGRKPSYEPLCGLDSAALATALGIPVARARERLSGQTELRASELAAIVAHTGRSWDEVGVAAAARVAEGS